MIDLRNGDCLEVMKSIPDKSIDAIIADFPYGTMNTDGRRKLGINGWDFVFNIGKERVKNIWIVLWQDF